MQRRTLAQAALASTLSTLLPAAHAQASPALRLIVPYAPGGASDRAARIVADQLGAQLDGRTVIVENKPGAGGRLAAQQLKASPDTHTLLLANPAIMVVAPLVFKDNGYQPEQDFQPVAHINDYTFGLAVARAVPVKELSHLLAWLRANPAQANLGVPATGSLPHFFALMMASKAQIQAEVVGYRGSAPLLNDLLGGQVPVAFDTLDSLLPQHQGGKLRILATSGAQRAAQAPDIPTFTQAGLDLVATGWNAFFASAAMPRPQAERLGQAIRTVMQDPATRQRFAQAHMTPVAAGAADTAAMLKAYRVQWAPVVQTSGYTP